MIKKLIVVLVFVFFIAIALAIGFTLLSGDNLVGQTSLFKEIATSTSALHNNTKERSLWEVIGYGLGIIISIIVLSIVIALLQQRLPVKEEK
jgi:hypothetical protein